MSTPPSAEPIETFILVATIAPERPTAYVCKGTRTDVVKRAQHAHFWVNVFSLKAAASQTSNPWNATIITHEAIAHPINAFDEAIRYATHHLDGMSVEQQLNALDRARAILDNVLLAKTSGLTETLENEI